jgi:hypothetical protein
MMRRADYVRIAWSTWRFLVTVQGGAAMPVARLVPLFAMVVLACAASVSRSAGVARSENFSVYVPDHPTRQQAQQFAERLLERAQQFRREIAVEWLGEELPAGAGKTIIYVEYSDVEDFGLTWAKDGPERHYHTIWLHTSPQSATGETLKHEIAHSVFATKYPHPNRLPSWVEEGIASRYDNHIRSGARAQLLRFWGRTGRAAQLAPILESTDLKSFDENSYAAATSLVSFLLARGGERVLMRFAEDGQRSGWNAALHSHYGIESMQQLQSDWQGWLAEGAREH